MKLQLRTDYWDYYDAHFDLDGDVLNRFSRKGMSRREMFVFLQNRGFPTPQNGVLRSLTGLGPEERVVVYLDEMQHQGEGKVLLTYAEAMRNYPDHYASQYIPSIIDGKVETWRYLQLGNQTIWLKYRSDDEWRSNCGDVEIGIVSHHISGKPIKIEQPLYAIDYVGESMKYAVDFNEAPGIKGTGIEDIYSPKQVVDCIKAGIERIAEENLFRKGLRSNYGC